MKQLSPEDLAWYRERISVFVYPVRGYDKYTVVFFFGQRKIGRLQMDGLELASMRFGGDEETNLEFKPWAKQWD